MTSRICYGMELARYCVHKLKIQPSNNLSLFWIAHLFALELRYDLNTQVHTKVKLTTGYIITIRCWQFSLSCAVIRICPSTSPHLSWLLGRCDIAWIGDSVEFSHVVHVVKTVRLSSHPQPCCHYVTNVTGDTLCWNKTNQLRVNLKSWPTPPNTLWF